jgi:hypothetical protein
MRVVIKASGISECLAQSIFACMPERRVAEIMSQAQGFRQVFVQPEHTSNGPADLRDLDAVRQSDPEVVAVGRDEHLRLVAQAAEGDGMDDPVAVALESVARPARTTVRLGMQAAARTRRLRRNAWRKLHQVPIGTI